MSIDHNFPRLAIDPGAFCHALERGELEYCLEYLRSAPGEPELAPLACTFAEKMFHLGDRVTAVECARIGFAAADGDTDVLDFCAWLFSNCGCYAEAAAAYERLIERRPDWVEGYRHASGALFEAGAVERAIAFALYASDRRTGDAEYALHAGCLLLGAGRSEEALTYLSRAAAAQPAYPDALRGLSAASQALGRAEQALGFALRAADAAPERHDLAEHAAELLLRAERPDDALALLDAARHRHPAQPALWRLVSAAQMQCGAVDAALGAVERALELDPANIEYHLHFAHLLKAAGDLPGAAAILDHADALDPANVAVKRAQLDLLAADGQFAQATAIGGELLRAHPEDEAAAEAVLRVLNRRLDTIDGDFVVLDERRRAARPAPRAPGFAERLKSQGRVLQALIIRETRTRFGESRLGYAWALIEPILHIVLLSAVFSLLMHGRPPLGTHFFVFYYTGLIPYHVFVHTSTSMTHAVTSNGSLLQLPPVKPFDVILSRGCLELMTDIVVAVALLAGFAAAGIATMPADLSSVSVALLVTALLGCGVGFVNAVVQTLFRSWDKLWNNATRLLYFFSGIFYVPSMMPDRLRDILAWNPLLHAIDWFRSGFFANYQPHWLDRGYLVVGTAIALCAGLAAERGLRRHLVEPA